MKMNIDLSKKLKGIIPPMITPLSNRDTIDRDGLERLIEHLIYGGVQGLFILGTTGEAPGLSYKLRYELIKATCNQVDKRIPVFVGITDTSFSESVKIANYSADMGADGLVVAPPYYFPIAQEELTQYIENLSCELPLPVVLYNMPGCTKVMISPETVCRIADIPNVIGLKDSSADMFYFNKLKTYLANRPDFRILIGPEELLTESLLMGCDGGVSGGANIFPQLYVDLYNSVISGNAHKAKKLHKIIMKISSTIYNTGKYDSSIIKGIKCSLKILGICNDFIAEPFHKFQNSEYEKVRNHLEEILNSNEYKFFFSNKTNSKLSINSLTKNNRSLKTKPQNQYSS